LANEKIFNLDLDLEFPISDYGFSNSFPAILYFRPSKNYYVSTWDSINKVYFKFIDSFTPTRIFEYTLDKTDIVDLNGEKLLKLTLDTNMINVSSYYKVVVQLNDKEKANYMNISIFDISTLEMSTLLKVIDKGEVELLRYLQSIKKDMLNVPNGVAVLNANKKIEEIYLPKEYREHINTKLIHGEAHKTYIDPDGLMWFYNADTSAWQKVSNQKTPPGDLPPVITVKDGIVTIKYNPATVVAQQKWTIGEQDVPYFKTGGTIFSGTSFKVTKSGKHTLYYKNGSNKEFAVVFDVLETDIPFLLPTFTKKNGIVTINHKEPEKVDYQKFAAGTQSKEYFQLNGTLINDNTFIVTQSGIYTVYYKLKDGREITQQLIINESDLPQDEPPQLSIKDSVVTLTFVDHMNILNVKWTYGKESKEYFQTNGSVVINNVFEVYAVGEHTLYYQTDKGEYIMSFTISSGQLKPDPTVSVIINKGMVTVAYPQGITVSLSKWDKGKKDIIWFRTNGNTFTENKFLVTEIGEYTLYYKTVDNKEYVKLFTVSNDQLPPQIVPRYNKTGTNIDILVADKTIYTHSLYAIGHYTVGDFTSGALGQTVTDWKIPYDKKEEFTHYYKVEDGREGVGYIVILDEDLLHSDPDITVQNGLAKVKHEQSTGITVVQQKWAYGSQPMRFFTEQNQGVIIVDNKFYVTQAGTHTLYYELSNGGRYVMNFNVLQSQLEKPLIPPTISIVNGLVTVTFDQTTNTLLRKWDVLSRDIMHFQTKGNTFTGNTFTVPSAGLYTLYYKLDNEKEHVQEFTVTEDQMKPKFIPPRIDIVRGVAKLTYDPSMNVTLNKWEYGENTETYFKTNGQVITNSTFNVTKSGRHSLYTVLDNKYGYVIFFEVSSDQLYVPDKPPIIQVSNGVVTITHDANTKVATSKWDSGVRDVAHFQSSGKNILGNKFTVELAGDYTYYYKNIYGEEFVYTFTVTENQLPYYQPVYSIVDGLMIIDFRNPDDDVVLTKIAEGNQTKDYFKDNGIIFTNNQYQFTKAGTYTLYWKLDGGRDFIIPITVTQNQIDKHVPPAIQEDGATITIVYTPETEQYVTEKKWDTGSRTINYFEDKGNVLTSNNFTSNGGLCTYYYMYKGRGFTIEFGENFTPPTFIVKYGVVKVVNTTQ